MTEELENRNLETTSPMLTPRQAKRDLPVGERAAETVLSAREAVRDALHGRDANRLVLIVGPCSLHDPEAALEYARRLLPLAKETADDLIVVMRTYFEKPRTTVGWKGLINDPHLDGSCDVPEGLLLARRLLLEINGLGLPCASEVLDPVTPQYLADLLSWAAIGARTTESQTHREMASGLSMPVGFKNGTAGDLQSALNGIDSAAEPHSFLGINPEGVSSVIKTKGNPDRHVVLRGGPQPNYRAAEVAQAAAATAARGLARGVMVDCSHDNSGKDHERQAEVCRAVLEQARAPGSGLLGLMLESNLFPGRQDWQAKPRKYGVSITDACIGFEETETLVREAAAAARALSQGWGDAA